VSGPTDRIRFCGLADQIPLADPRDISQLLVFLLPLVLVAVVAGWSLPPAADQDAIDFVNRSLLIANSDSVGEWLTGLTDTRDPPLRYLPLSTLYLLTGTTEPTETAFRLAELHGSVASFVAVPLALYGCVRLTFGHREGLLAVVVLTGLRLFYSTSVGVYAVAYQYSLSLPFVLLGLGAAHRAVTAARADTRRRWAVAVGASMGVAALVQSTLPLFGTLAATGGYLWRHRYRELALSGVVGAVAVLPVAATGTYTGRAGSQFRSYLRDIVLFYRGVRPGQFLPYLLEVPSLLAVVAGLVVLVLGALRPDPWAETPVLGTLAGLFLVAYPLFLVSNIYLAVRLRQVAGVLMVVDCLVVVERVLRERTGVDVWAVIARRPLALAAVYLAVATPLLLVRVPALS
jgi:hypothetical protein